LSFLNTVALYNIDQIASLVIDITVIGLYGYELVGAGIWGGVFYIIAGSLGWAAASKRSKSL